MWSCLLVLVIYKKIYQKDFLVRHLELNLFQLVHSDISDPLSDRVRHKDWYFITFTNYSDCYGLLYLIYHKSKAISYVRSFFHPSGSPLAKANVLESSLDNLVDNDSITYLISSGSDYGDVPRPKGLSVRNNKKFQYDNLWYVNPLKRHVGVCGLLVGYFMCMVDIYTTFWYIL